MDQAEKARIQTYYISLFVSILLMLAKFYAYSITYSKAIMSDAFESIINVLTPIVGIIVLIIAHKPADKDHPYGHGKVEYFSSGIEGGLILFAALTILYEGVKALVKSSQITELDNGLYISVATGVVNLALGYFVIKRGQKYSSLALKANGKHILSDVWTTAGVIIGLVLVRLTGLVWLDAVTAIVMAFSLGYDGFKIMRESAAGLLDEEDPQLIQEIAQLFNRHRIPGIIHIHHTRVIKSGRYHHIDAHVVVPEYWDIPTAHEKTKEFEQAVIHDYTVGGEIHFHLDPCRKAYCVVCEEKDCPIRQKPFSWLLPFTIDSLISPIEPDEYAANEASKRN